MSDLPQWLHTIPLPMPAPLGQVNAYLIEGPHGAALIDTGMDEASSRRELERGLEVHGMRIADLDALVCTHHHVDHAGLGATFREAGVETMMSALDMESLAAFFAQPELDDVRAGFYGRHEVPSGFAKRVSKIFPFFRSLAEEFRPDRALVDGDRLDLGGIEFEVLLTPGHTRGHVCLHEPEAGVVFTGDCVINREATHISMRPEAMGTDPLGGFLSSLETIAGLGPRVGLPGHGGAIDDLVERARDIERHHRRRLEQVRRSLTEEPRTAFDISKVAVDARPKAFARWLAVSQALAYLEHLVRRGEAKEHGADRGLRYSRLP